MISEFPLGNANGTLALTRDSRPSDSRHDLEQLLQKRLADKSYRELPLKSHLIDFCSNDYLGYSRSALLQEKIKKQQISQKYPRGATGSRLITGNSEYVEELEKKIAAFHKAPAGLIFNSGFDANLGFFSAVPQKNDLIIFDELIHASARDGIKLSRARAIEFHHNDVEDLKMKMVGGYDHVYVAVESVYSMDGDFAPLNELAELCREKGARLVVDEAHATGMFGANGEGRVVEAGVENDCFARIHTFGKALGCFGAIIVGSELLRKFLINFSRPFIFSTALPFENLVAVKCAYELLPLQQRKIKKVQRLVDLLKKELAVENLPLLPSDSPIQSVLIPGNENALKASAVLEVAGFYAKAILYPTVARGKERLRVVLHSFNTEEQVRGLTAILKNLLPSKHKDTKLH